MRKELIGKNRLRDAVLVTFVLSGAVVAAYSNRTPPIASLPAVLPYARLPVLRAPNIALPLFPDLRLRAAPRPTNQNAANQAEALLYRKIFALQQAGQWAQADAAMAGLADGSLRGTALAQRYLSERATPPGFTALADWLTRYADLPGADAIYRLAQAQAPEGTVLQPPARPDAITGYLDMFADRSDDYASSKTRTPGEDQAVSTLNRQIRDAVAHGLGSKAENLLSYTAAAKHLDPVEYDQLRAQVASAFYYAGKFPTALNLSIASAQRSGADAPLAGWIGGLAAWRQGRYQMAASLFELTALSPYVSPWSAAGGAYWAWRAHSRAGETAAARAALERAATFPRTFYGLLALRQLNRRIDFHWDLPQSTPARLAKLEALPAGRRAIALVTAGQPRLAERELLQINPGDDRALAEALLAYADEAGLPALAMRLAEAVPYPGGGAYDAALYPLSPWTPANGYTVDRALIHAIVRQESRFNPAAQSQSGAIGLMQLMPATANDIGGRPADRPNDRKANADAPALDDPETNLELGQRYVVSLMGQEPVSSELFSVIAAYNAGPRNLRHWKDGMNDNTDPLLFLESIPVTQTRTFTEHVMANYWIYALRLKQPVPSLAAIAGGKWARYVAMDEVQHAALEPSDLRTANIR